ncbi:hypothetical protein BDA99DRAFT_535615 [Phascolomyces articulosus]|uniref:Ubiquitin-like domain-containing protein n=1 Tax=Phascolomyces articulosus TaxID=60185 RepID=A0AAD5PHF5_9FUNG|nr:hypothetical protein BDA99DRAFT_535615 [Phascolomyces articulosus]
MEQSKKIKIFIANFPGLSIDIPSREDEDLQFLLDRVSNKLLYTEFGNLLTFKNHLYVNGIKITDYTKSSRQYSVFGDIFTYSQDNNNCSSNTTPSDNTSAAMSMVNHTPQKQQMTMTGFNTNNHYNNGSSSSSGPKTVTTPLVPKYKAFPQRKTSKSSTINVNIVSIHISLVLTVHQRDTVEDLKKEIMHQLGRSCRHLSSPSVTAKIQHHLFFNGSELENKNALSHYNIQQNATIYLVFPPSSSSKDQKWNSTMIGDIFLSSSKTDSSNYNNSNNKMISITTLAGKRVFNNIHLEQSAWNIKAMIYKKKGVPMDQQRLVYAGKELKENHQTLLQQCKELSDKKTNLSLCTIYLVYRLSNPRGINPINNSFSLPVVHNVIRHTHFPKSTMTDSQQLEIVPRAAKGLQIIKGLNIVTHCQCTPFHPVILKFGYGLYEIMTTTDNTTTGASLIPNSFSLFADEEDDRFFFSMQCPNCHYPIRNNKNMPISFGFVECYYRFFYMAKNGNARSRTEWTRVSAQDQYQHFDITSFLANKASENWKQIGIEARPFVESNTTTPHFYENFHKKTCWLSLLLTRSKLVPTQKRLACFGIVEKHWVNILLVPQLWVLGSPHH